MDELDDVAVELADEFGDRLAETTVATVVDGARHDLQGQVVPGAFAEMVHRLAHTRLDVLSASHT